VQLCAAAKNVVAVAAGASDGWTVFFSEKRLPGVDAARAVLRMAELRRSF